VHGMIEFYGVSGGSTELTSEEPATHAASAIDIFFIVDDFRNDPAELSCIRTIAENDHQQHRDETGTDPQGDIHDGLA